MIPIIGFKFNNIIQLYTQHLFTAEQYPLEHAFLKYIINL